MDKYLDNRQHCSWINLYYGIVSNVINENNFKKCAEIGIGYGYHAREILENTNVEQLYLVDPSRYYPNDLFPEDVLRIFGDFETLVSCIKQYLEPFASRYTWLRKCSTDVTNQEIEDGTLDCVFIDGDHSYEAVSQDLPFWWNKLRVGGWMLGDDYESLFVGTKQAVDEFAAKMNLKLEFLTKGNYKVFKLIKTH